MTASDEQRKACIEAMANAAFNEFCLSAGLNPNLDEHPACTKAQWRKIQAAAFDALHGIATICAPEATDEMIEAANKEWDGRMSARSCGVWRVMAAAGDLTENRNADR